MSFWRLGRQADGGDSRFLCFVLEAAERARRKPPAKPWFEQFNVRRVDNGNCRYKIEMEDLEERNWSRV